MTTITKTASVTSDGTGQILDFSLGAEVVSPAMLRENAGAFIISRWNKSKRLMAEQIKNAIEIGSAYQKVFEMFQSGAYDDMTYTEWVQDMTIFDADTVLNYRNLYTTFKTIIPTIPGEALDGVQIRALYKLAVDTVSDSARTWFLDKMLENHRQGEIVLKGNLDLVAVSKHVTVRSWLDENPPYINFEQAVSLVKALPRCESVIQEICLSERVKDGTVVLVLNRLFLDFCRANDDVRGDKSWADIVNNEYCFVWNGGERSVHISKASAETCELYLNDRQMGHIFGNASNKKKPPRKTASIKRSGNQVIITINETDFLPEGFTEGEISLDILLDTLK